MISLRSISPPPRVQVQSNLAAAGTTSAASSSNSTSNGTGIGPQQQPDGLRGHRHFKVNDSAATALVLESETVAFADDDVESGEENNGTAPSRSFAPSSSSSTSTPTPTANGYSNSNSASEANVTANNPGATSASEDKATRPEHACCDDACGSGSSSIGARIHSHADYSEGKPCCSPTLPSSSSSSSSKTDPKSSKLDKRSIKSSTVAVPNVNPAPTAASDIVKLNVGGTIFWTSRQTLMWHPDTFFEKLLQGTFGYHTDETGAIFIDRDPVNFRVILNFLRSYTLDLEECPISVADLRQEAEFFGLSYLVEHIESSGYSKSNSCGGIMFSGVLRSDPNAADDEKFVTAITGDHNWIVVAYVYTFSCFRYKENTGWCLQYKSPPLEEPIERVALSNRFGDHGDKMFAVSFKTMARLWQFSISSNKVIAGVKYNLGKQIDSIFFVGTSMVVTSESGRVGVWNSASRNWQVQDILPVTSYDFVGSMLFLGCDNGTICFIDLEKFPLRLKDDSLLVSDYFHDPNGERITSLSVFLTTTAAGPNIENFIEIAYGTSTGCVRVVVQHPESGHAGLRLFQTFCAHDHPIKRVMLTERHLISVCKKSNHTRSWKVTRFRGKISTQPGSVPFASFQVPSAPSLGVVGPFGDRLQRQVFVQSFGPDLVKMAVLDAASGKRICLIESINGSPFTCFYVDGCDFPSVSPRSRRFLLCGTEDGQVQIWDLTTAFELIESGDNIKKSKKAISNLVEMVM